MAQHNSRAARCSRHTAPESVTGKPFKHMSTQYNEAGLMEYIRQNIQKYKPQFPDVRELSVGVSNGADSVIVHGFVGAAGWDSQFGYGQTFDEAAADLRLRLATPESRARGRRERAERLIEEANALEANKP